MDYGALISIAAFFVAIQIATKTNAHALLPASVAVALPYIVNLILNYIRAVGFGLPILPNLFTLASTLTFVVQFILSIYIFKRIRDEDDILLTLCWGVGGAILVILAVPLLASLIHF